MSLPRSFSHERLIAYRLALEWSAEVVRFTRTLPAGCAVVRDQMQRSALAVVRPIAEAASRMGPADRRARFSVARGECAECDATLESLAMVEPTLLEPVVSLRASANRLAALLTGLVGRERQRVLDGDRRGPGGTRRDA